MNEKINIDNLGTDINDSTDTEKIVIERFKKEGLPLSIIVDDKDKYDNIKCWQCGNSYINKLKITEAITDRMTDLTLLCYKCGCISTIRFNEGKYEPIKCLICNSKTTKIKDTYRNFKNIPLWDIIYSMVNSEKGYHVCWYCMQTHKEEINEIINEYKRKKYEKREKIKRERLENRMNELLRMSKEELIDEITRLDEELSDLCDPYDQ